MDTTPKPVPTQVKHGWRATLRTVVAAVVGFAPLAPAIYQAATTHNPDAATGWAALALGLCGAITRVMALPGVEAFLQRFLPFLAATPRQPGA